MLCKARSVSHLYSRCCQSMAVSTYSMPWYGRPIHFADIPKLDASDEVDDAFPDVLKEPILRSVQFSTMSRLDHLGMASNI